MNPQAATTLISQAGINEPYSLVPLAGGANNRVFRVDCDSGPLILKEYFNHPNDSRDRAASEFAFAQFAWSHGLRCLPEPLACNLGEHVGLYRFLEGRRISPSEINSTIVGQALTFYKSLNVYRDASDAATLPLGSEVCFNLGSHAGCVERRILRLRDLQPSDTIEQEALDFIRSTMVPLWESIRATFREESRSLGIAGKNDIATADRRLSASDFGFHNAVMGDSGDVSFFDFEYAGWDDPAKVVCDFFCQPAISVPKTLFDSFQHGVTEDLQDPQWHSRRISMLFPVYQMKWACIMLNDFLPTSGERRRFAQEHVDESGRKARQLRKAEDCLKEIEVRA